MRVLKSKDVRWNKIKIETYWNVNVKVSTGNGGKFELK